MTPKTANRSSGARRFSGAAALALALVVTISSGLPGRALDALDWSFTAGKLCTEKDPDFHEFRYAEHIAICKYDVTAQTKKEVAAHYGVPESDWKKYQFRFLIPRLLGGANSSDNIWPQPLSGDALIDLDNLETSLVQQITEGKVTLSVAVAQLRAWWDPNKFDGGYTGEFTLLPLAHNGQFSFTINKGKVAGQFSGGNAFATKQNCFANPQDPRAGYLPMCGTVAGSFSGAIDVNGRIRGHLTGALATQNSDDTHGPAKYMLSGELSGRVTWPDQGDNWGFDPKKRFNFNGSTVSLGMTQSDNNSAYSHSVQINWHAN